MKVEKFPLREPAFTRVNGGTILSRKEAEIFRNRIRTVNALPQPVQSQRRQRRGQIGPLPKLKLPRFRFYMM